MCSPMHSNAERLVMPSTRTLPACVVLLATAAAAPIRAQTTVINTIPVDTTQWGAAATIMLRGMSFRSPTPSWELFSAGQSFVAPTSAPVLTSVTIPLTSFFGGENLIFSAYVMAWDASTRAVTGPVLYRSAPQNGIAGGNGSENLQLYT